MGRGRLGPAVFGVGHGVLRSPFVVAEQLLGGVQLERYGNPEIVRDLRIDRVVGIGAVHHDPTVGDGCAAAVADLQRPGLIEGAVPVASVWIRIASSRWAFSSSREKSR